MKFHLPAWRSAACWLAAGLASLAFLPPAAAPQAAPPPSQAVKPGSPLQLRGGVNLVDVPVLVLDHQGQPVLGLNRSNFSLWDNRLHQQLSGFDSQPLPVSVAIVVDTTEPAAVEQAHRSAQLIASMIVGADGRGSVITAGYHTRQVLHFTNERGAIVDALRRLKLGPHGNDITEALDLAILRLNHQPLGRTRAVVVITRQQAVGGEFAHAIVQAAMSDATPIFRVVPNSTGPRPPNPISPTENGTGVGSNREQHPAQPIGRAGNPVPCEGCEANLSGALVDALGKLYSLVRSKHWNYVRATGGLDLHAGNNRDFDRRLQLVANALRSFYHLYFTPNDLTAYAEVHAINLRIVGLPHHGHITYRRTYVGLRQ